MAENKSWPWEKIQNYRLISEVYVRSVILPWNKLQTTGSKNKYIAENYPESNYRLQDWILDLKSFTVRSLPFTPNMMKLFDQFQTFIISHVFLLPLYYVYCTFWNAYVSSNIWNSFLCPILGYNFRNQSTSMNSTLHGPKLRFYIKVY